jgi:hypothetical protein
MNFMKSRTLGMNFYGLTPQDIPCQISEMFPGDHIRPSVERLTLSVFPGVMSLWWQPGVSEQWLLELTLVSVPIRSPEGRPEG